MTASFASIPAGKLNRAESGESVPVGEVAVLALDRRVSAKSGRLYTAGATFLTSDDVEHECRVGRVLGKQLASLSELPCRVTITVRTSSKGHTYKTIA